MNVRNKGECLSLASLSSLV